MLGDPKRLRTPRGHGYLVGWRDRLRANTEPEAAALVERILDDPHNVQALRHGIGRPEASLEDLAQWLVTGLTSGALELLKTRTAPPVLDRPPETNLVDLLPPEAPKPDVASLTFEVLDNLGEGVPVRYQVYAPSGDPAGSLPGGERRFVGELQRDDDVEVELSAIQLPLRPTIEPDDGGKTRPSPDDVPPERAGHGSESQDPPSDDATPTSAPFPLLRATPAPYKMRRVLALPGETAEHRHFIPVVLVAIAASRSSASTEVWVVSLGSSAEATTRASSVEAVFHGSRSAWIELATERGSLDDIRTYFSHLKLHRGWPIPLERGSKAAVEAFQVAYNTRFDSAILEDGVCGTQTLGAVFDVLSDELRRWLPTFGLAQADLHSAQIHYVAEPPAGVDGPRRNEGAGLDVWVIDGATLPCSPSLDLLYADQRAEVHSIDIPWSFETDDVIVRLRANTVEDLDGFVSVRLERSDGSWSDERELDPSTLAQDVLFPQVKANGHFTVSLVRTNGVREVLVANAPFSTFLDDRRSPT